MSQRLPPNFQIAISLLLLVFIFAAISLLNAFKVESIAPAETAVVDSFFFDLEGETPLENLNTIREGIAFSGKKSCVLDESTEYSVTFSRAMHDLPDHKIYSEINISFYIFAFSPIQSAEVVYTLNSDDNVMADYQSQSIKITEKTWQKVNFKFILNDDFRNDNGKFKVYIWNKKKEKLIIDNLFIIFK